MDLIHGRAPFVPLCVPVPENFLDSGTGTNAGTVRGEV